MFAAKVAVKHSIAKHSGYVEVDYAKAICAETARSS